jgi:MFS family permease
VEIKLKTAYFHSLPSGIWALGFVSMLMDISSEMIHGLLPVYLVGVLGTSVLTVGVIEGIAESTACITKVFSGALSDWLGRRKLLAALGYGMAAFTKPIFPLASTVEWIIAARFIDRIGKGIRGAPRDALIADIAPPHLRGASFGLRQSMDSVGSFLGPLLAIGLMWLTADHYKIIFWAASVPAFLALGLIVFAVHESPRPKNFLRGKFPLSLSELKRLGGRYWWVTAVAAIFTLARFSEAFLILRAQQVGIPVMLVPAVLIVMNVVYALAAYPAGIASDCMNRVILLVTGIILLMAADLVLGLTAGVAGLIIGVALWGLHMGFTQGILSALIAEAAPPELRGTAFGMFNLVTGLALLIASIVAGALWDSIGSKGTFLAGAAFAAVAGILYLYARKLFQNKQAL